MALKTCGECGHSVSDQGKSCPGCGAPAPLNLGQKVVRTFYSIIFLAIVLGFVAHGVGGG